MKKTLKILLISTIVLMVLTVVSNAFTMQANVDKATIKVGEEVVYTIKLDEKVVATNFNINYNSTSFELVGSNTQGLNVAEKNGKVAAIYADLSGVGTDQLSIKFKAKAEITNAEISIEDAKFRGVDKDTSYVGENIVGLNNKTNITIQKVTNIEDVKEEEGKKDDTTSIDKLPNTGVGIGLALIIVIVLFGMVNQKIKMKKIKDIVPVLLGIVVVASITTVRAEGVNITEGYTHIELSKDDSDRKITKQELMSKNTSIISIKNKEGQELQNTDIVKTGYEITTAEGTSKAILYGDANGDGIVCDTDDIMVIIDTYLGKITPDEITKKAANLCNTDDVLDIDDIMQMMNMYLGKLEGTLVTNPITEENQEGDKINVDLYVKSLETTYAINEREIKIIKLNSSEEEISGTERIYKSNNNGWINLELVLNKTEHAKYKIIDVESSKYYKFMTGYNANEYYIETLDSTMTYELGKGSFGKMLLEFFIAESNNTDPQPEEEMLSTVAKVGDLVNYPIQYTSIGRDYHLKPEWRVWKIDGEVVTLMATAGVSSESYQTMNLYISNTNKQILQEKLDTYLDTRYAESVEGAPKEEDVMNWFRNNNQDYIRYFANDTEFWVAGANIIPLINDYRNGVTTSRADAEIGLRPIIKLKTGIKTTGQGENGWELLAE